LAVDGQNEAVITNRVQSLDIDRVSSAHCFKGTETWKGAEATSDFQVL
jgi:hypothetical protein